jgi:hydrogenase maturation protease
MDELRRLADAVLYEGYLLWPYRRTALKNQGRWTFGCVFPPKHHEAHPDDLCAIQAQCLLEAAGEPEVEVTVRFLHAVTRSALGEKPWDEATEREISARPGRTEIAVEAGTDEEPQVVRAWRSLRGRVDVAVEPLRDGLHRVTVRVANTTPWDGGDRDDALRSAFCSAHAVLSAAGGAFVSATDPPQELSKAAAACEHVGVWPVLVGEQGSRETMLASPIILEDYPQIATESPGDLFDAGEIDRLLILNVLSLTEAEQEEMRATDPRAREILERCEALRPDELLALHGRLTAGGR